MCFGLHFLVDTMPHFVGRIIIVSFIFILAYLNQTHSGKFILFARNFYPLFFLSFFYAETGYLKNIILNDNLDFYFAGIDQAIWGFQPSLQFSKAMSQGWFNELMNISYFSYYAITVVICVALYRSNKQLSYKPIFIVVFSFYMYYIIFDVFPVTGPQYYFDTMAKEPTPPYFFGKIMRYLLLEYEKPTGAFPSSHVGLALIVSYISFKNKKSMFYYSLPFVIGICFATVYLKAHYAIDVIGAVVTAPIFIIISGSVYNKLLLLNTAFKQNS
jgi:membrane-associated phospholipid phosphatase